MFLFLVAAIAVAAPHVKAARDGHRVVLTLPMQAAIDRFDPTFRVWLDRDFAPGLVDEFDYSMTSAPFAAIGDFNGDGRLDAVLAGRTSKRSLFLVVLSSRNGYRATPISNARPDPANGSPPGRRGSIVYLELVTRGAEVVPFGEPPLFRLQHDAFQIVHWEKASELYYLKNGSWKSVITGD
jgi:hypothetical protein